MSQGIALIWSLAKSAPNRNRKVSMKCKFIHNAENNCLIQLTLYRFATVYISSTNCNLCKRTVINSVARTSISWMLGHLVRAFGSLQSGKWTLEGWREMVNWHSHFHSLALYLYSICAEQMWNRLRIKGVSFSVSRWPTEGKEWVTRVAIFSNSLNQTTNLSQFIQFYRLASDVIVRCISIYIYCSSEDNKKV